MRRPNLHCSTYRRCGKGESLAGSSTQWTSMYNVGQWVGPSMKTVLGECCHSLCHNSASAICSKTFRPVVDAFMGRWQSHRQKVLRPALHGA